VDGTLGYAGSVTVNGQSPGTVTATPAVGQVVSSGQKLYEVDAKPVVLLQGSTPAYRALSQGMKGPDVAELNADLVALGYATSSELSPAGQKFSYATTKALKRFQGVLGVERTGRLALGDAVFLPSALRVTEVSASAGSSASGPILTGTSTTRIVTVDLGADQQSQVEVGDKVTVTLPDHSTTTGVVWSVGTVATAAKGSGDGGQGDATSSGATVKVQVALDDPAATGRVDQAPVKVSVTSRTVADALAVPVDALLALAGGGYGVEVDRPGGARRLVPVELGLFDDADGLVQVSGRGLAAGQHVVVPSP
ncbi:MAG TPA: peptidoglycan-binding domain-containing protein, partial [Acidimicrobiales bacterium]